MKRETVKIVFEYQLEYEHVQHKEQLIKDICKEPIAGCSGAGFIGGTCYSYSIQRTKKDGEVLLS